MIPVLEIGQLQPPCLRGIIIVDNIRMTDANEFLDPVVNMGIYLFVNTLSTQVYYVDESKTDNSHISLFNEGLSDIAITPFSLLP